MLPNLDKVRSFSTSPMDLHIRLSITMVVVFMLETPILLISGPNTADAAPGTSNLIPVDTTNYHSSPYNSVYTNK